MLKKHNPNSIMIDEYFDKIVRLMVSFQTVNDRKRMSIMRSYPNKIGYKWLRHYDVLVVESSNVLIYKQKDGSALDTCQNLLSIAMCLMLFVTFIKCGQENNHPKSKTLYRRVVPRMARSFLTGCVKYSHCIVQYAFEPSQGRSLRQYITPCLHKE